MKRPRLSALAFFAVFSAALPAHAQQVSQPLTGAVWATTDYVNRGISRSDGPALQGRIQLNHAPTGLFAGAAASTVDLNTDPDANVETVLFGGLQGNYEGIDYNGKLSWYAYPGGNNGKEDYVELALTGGYDFGPFYASGTWAFSPDYINGSGASFYYGADLVVPVVYDLKAKAHMGFQFVNRDNSYIQSGAMDWGLGLWYNYAPWDMDIGLQYTDTDLSKSECREHCGARAALVASKDFGM
ncbi:MAG: hypothetical protein H6865_06175 [Rhodospirillales bacterium]|nr:TorF family putative porin [Alphaproteobacteria bacterium]MCB9987208.1 hypothetical protein [Rhodospirillales bacterium]USO07930.1 MAG: hypothetical protein H6866_01525 [Rhodospirillales bacterium]